MQKVDLYQPIVHCRVGSAPLTLRVGVTPNVANIVGGVPTSTHKIETYVLLSALPEEIRKRVELAVQALVSGM